MNKNRTLINFGVLFFNLKNREKMKEKSIFTEEELMQCSKEFLCATVLRQEKQADYWFKKYIELQKEFNQFISNEINNKEKLLK